MKTKVKEWMNGRLLGFQEAMCKKSPGMGTVEVILIIVCLIGIVIIFKSQITDLVEGIFSKITSQTNRI